MTSRDRTVLAVVLSLGLIVGGWILLIAPKQSQAGRLQSQINSAQAQLHTEQAAVASGLAARSAYGSYYTELARLGEAVPANDDVPSLIYQVQHAASASGVDFRGLVVTSSTSSAPAAASATQAPGATSAAATSSLPPGVTESPAGLPEEPFTLTFNGSFFHLASFLGRLQRFVTVSDRDLAVSGRLMSLNSVTFAAGPSGFPQIAATITATTYLVPSTQTQAIGPASGLDTAGSGSASSTSAAAAAITPPVR